MNRPYLNTVISILLFAICATSWADLTAKVDRTTLYTDETLQFVMRYNGQAITSEPDFSPLKKDFDILSNNRQQQYSWVNGKAQSYTDWNMVLMPKRTGVILIPSISFKKDVSNALEITVRTANKITAGGSTANEGIVYSRKQYLFKKRPAGGSAPNEWRAYYPATNYRLSPRPISISYYILIYHIISY